MTAPGITPERKKRIQKVEEYMLKGMSASGIAIRFGVEPSTIERDQRLIRKNWRKRYLRNKGDRRRYRVKQLERVQQASWDSYERSKESQIEVTIQNKPEICPFCKDGLLPDDSWCDKCDGEGIVTISVETTRTKGREGDSGHLRLGVDALKEINKLEGNYPAEEVKVEGSVGITGLVNANLDAGGQYSTIAASLLLNALSAIASAGEKTTTNIVQAESKVISEEQRP